MQGEFWEIIKSAMPEALGALLATAIIALIAVFWKRLRKSFESVQSLIDEAIKSVTPEKIQTGDTTGQVSGINVSKSSESSQQGELGKAEGRGWLFKIFGFSSSVKTDFGIKGSSASASTKGSELEIKTDSGHIKAGQKPNQNEQVESKEDD